MFLIKRPVKILCPRRLYKYSVRMTMIIVTTCTLVRFAAFSVYGNKLKFSMQLLNIKIKQNLKSKPVKRICFV